MNTPATEIRNILDAAQEHQRKVWRSIKKAKRKHKFHIGVDFKTPNYIVKEEVVVRNINEGQIV